MKLEPRNGYPGDSLSAAGGTEGGQVPSAKASSARHVVTKEARRGADNLISGILHNLASTKTTYLGANSGEELGTLLKHSFGFKFYLCLLPCLLRTV